MIYTHAVAAILAALLAGTGAWQVQAWRYGAREAQRLEAARETERLRARVADQASAGAEADRATIRTEFQTIYSEVEKIVEKPVYRNVCLDADGLRELNRALGARPAASEPAPAVPGPEPAR